MPGIALVLSIACSFQETKDLDDLLLRFSRGYSNPDPKARATAVVELSKTPHEKTLLKIVPLLSGEVKEVRIAAAKGLGNFQGHKKAVTPALLAALAASPKDLDLQEVILGALGVLKDESALPVIHRSFRGPQMRVARAALGAAASIRRKETLGALLDLQRDILKWQKTHQGGGYKDESTVDDPPAQKKRLDEILGLVLNAFQAITREPWTTPGEWEIWCQKHLSTFTVPQ